MHLDPYAEEIANALTHGVGVIIFLVLCPLLIAYAVQSKDAGKVLGASFFSFGLLAVYFSSTIFHAIAHDFSKNILHYFDFIAIYFLISGTYTAVILTYFKDKIGYTLLAVIWTVSFLGIFLAIFKPNISYVYPLILYLVLGWAAVVLAKPLVKIMPRQILYLIICGGLSYTIGTYFYYHGLDTKFYHAIWHLFVLGGSLFHWTAIFLSIKK